MVCAVKGTVMVLVNVSVAGARVASPAWEKVNTHGPAASAVSEYAPGVPLTVQNSELASALVMVTGRPWLLLAVIVRESLETVFVFGTK
jgi:hypothetical protein